MIPVTSERIHPPEAFVLVSELEQAVLGIVALSAMRTLQVPVPSATPAVVLLGYREAVSATAWNQIHSQGCARVGWVLGGRPSWLCFAAFRVQSAQEKKAPGCDRKCP